MPLSVCHYNGKVFYLKHCRCHVYLILSISNVVLFPRAKQFTAEKAFNNQKSGQWKLLFLLLRILEVVVALKLRRSGVGNRSPLLPFQLLIFLAKLFQDLTTWIQNMAFTQLKTKSCPEEVITNFRTSYVRTPPKLRGLPGALSAPVLSFAMYLLSFSLTNTSSK